MKAAWAHEALRLAHSTRGADLRLQSQGCSGAVMGEEPASESPPSAAQSRNPGTAWQGTDVSPGRPRDSVGVGWGSHTAEALGKCRGHTNVGCRGTRKAEAPSRPLNLPALSYELCLGSPNPRRG